MISHLCYTFYLHPSLFLKTRITQGVSISSAHLVSGSLSSNILKHRMSYIICIKMIKQIWKKKYERKKQNIKTKTMTQKKSNKKCLKNISKDQTSLQAFISFEPRREKTGLGGFRPGLRSGTNWPIQSQKQA